MQSALLSQWLEKIKNQHRLSVDLGLERVREVAKRLGLLTPNYQVITVGGTNGKGSTVAGLEAVYLAAGYKVGAFTSPYLYRFNELVRIQGKEASDEGFIRAFEKIDQARGDMTLTQFEFNTLAALDIFQRANLDVGILEVGLGGRLDAVNIIDANVSAITSIAIDHAEWLGYTREEIAVEKAGIFRPGKSAVCGDFDPPTTLLEYVRDHQIPLLCQDKDFGFEQHERSWDWWGKELREKDLPLPRLALQNMATAMMVVKLLEDQLPVSRAAIDKALANVSLSGRIQVIPGPISRVLDVSHNPAAVEFLANYLQNQPYKGKVRAVFSMLADKDIVGTLYVMRDYVDKWYVAPLNVDRGSSASVLEYCFRAAKIQQFKLYSSIKQAYEKALADAQQDDCVVVFGSFYTVAAVGESG